VIVVALIGNVSALFSAVRVAQRNQMDLGFEIGISSAAQIALLVGPVLVIASPLLGNPVNILFGRAHRPDRDTVGRLRPHTPDRAAS
jgi:Ca2+:H+ antiporter